MHWEIERYVKVYTRDTPEWLRLSWQAQGLFCLLLRKADKEGVIEAHDPEDVARVLGLSVASSEIEPFLEELKSRSPKTPEPPIISDPKGMKIRNYRIAQTASQTDRLRKERQRQRARAILAPEKPERGPSENPKSGTSSVANSNGCRAVSHRQSQTVTDSHSISAIPAIPAIPDPGSELSGKLWDSGSGTNSPELECARASEKNHDRSCTGAGPGLPSSARALISGGISPEPGGVNGSHEPRSGAGVEASRALRSARMLQDGVSGPEASQVAGENKTPPQRNLEPLMGHTKMAELVSLVRAQHRAAVLRLRTEGVDPGAPVPSLHPAPAIEQLVRRAITDWLAEATELGRDPVDLVDERVNRHLASLEQEAREIGSLSKFRESACWSPGMITWGVWGGNPKKSNKTPRQGRKPI